jgi:hypothetical protein
MALDFPSSPATGQTFSSPAGTTWTYDGSKWGNGTVMTIPDAPSDANTYGRHAGSWNAVLTGITSAQVTGALGYTPYNQANPANYQTSAQVTAALPVASSTPPLMDGTVAIGTGTTWARADHVHASDTSRAPLASPNFTGTVNAPTITVGGNANPTLALTTGGAYTTLLAPDATAIAPNYAGIYIGTVASNPVNFYRNTSHSFQTRDASVTQMSLDVSGNLTIAGATATKPGGGSWVAPSDAALKAAIDPYPGGLKEVVQLEPIKYYYSGAAGLPTDEEFIGLDAAATARVMPELVGADSWTDPDGGETVHYSTVDSGPLIYALVNCVRELEARIAALEGARH